MFYIDPDGRARFASAGQEIEVHDDKVAGFDLLNVLSGEPGSPTPEPAAPLSAPDSAAPADEPAPVLPAPERVEQIATEVAETAAKLDGVLSENAAAEVLNLDAPRKRGRPRKAPAPEATPEV